MVTMNLSVNLPLVIVFLCVISSYAVVVDVSLKNLDKVKR